MELIDAINHRHSTRGFLDKPVSQETLRNILTLASKAASRVNAQPWQFAVITGAVLDQLRADNQRRLEAKEPKDKDYTPMPELYYRRRINTAKQLFASMNITKDDPAKKEWWSQRGYRYFDAPAIILLYMDADLDETIFRFDMGCVTQNICLAAMEYCLGTCIADQIIFYQKGLRQYLNIPDSKRFVTGIAIGYPDPDFPTNRVLTPREDIDSITVWYGF